MACELLKICTNAVTAEDLLNLLLKTALDTFPVIITSEADTPESCSAVDCNDVSWDLQTIAGMTATTDGFKVFTRVGDVTPRFTSCDNIPSLEQLLREVIAYDGTCYGINITTSVPITTMSCENMPSLLERIMMSFGVVDGCTVLFVTQVTATDENYIKCNPFSGALQSLSNALMPVDGIPNAYAWRVSYVGSIEPPEVLALSYVNVNDLVTWPLYKVRGITIDGNFEDLGSVDWNSDTDDLVAQALLNQSVPFGAVVSDFSDASYSPDPQMLGLSISQIPQGHTIVLNVTRTFNDFITTEDLDLPFTETIARTNKTATIVTPSPTTAEVQAPSFISVVFSQSTPALSTDITLESKWVNFLNGCNDFDFTVEIQIVNPTTTIVRILNSIIDLQNVQLFTGVPPTTQINFIDI